MEVAPAVENRQETVTPLQRLSRALSDFFSGLARITALSMLLAPVVILSILLVDIPVRGLDHFFSTPLLKPGNWLNRGALVMSLGPMLVVLFARRFGGDEAARAVTASWGIAAIAAFAEFTYLAPRIAPGDLPSARFTAAFVGSAMLAQYVAAGLYDVMRGGGGWWRAPLYSLLGAYFVQLVIYYPAAYWRADAPWLNWMVTDFGVRAALSVGFLAVYYFMRRRLKPRGGYGG